MMLSCRFIEGVRCGSCTQERGAPGWTYPPFSYCACCLILTITKKDLFSLREDIGGTKKMLKERSRTQMYELVSTVLGFAGIVYTVKGMTPFALIFDILSVLSTVLALSPRIRSVFK